MLDEHEEAKALERNSNIVSPALRARMKAFEQTRDIQSTKGKRHVQFNSHDSDPVAPTTKVTTTPAEEEYFLTKTETVLYVWYVNLSSYVRSFMFMNARRHISEFTYTYSTYGLLYLYGLLYVLYCRE